MANSTQKKEGPKFGLSIGIGGNSSYENRVLKRVVDKDGKEKFEVRQLEEHESEWGLGSTPLFVGKFKKINASLGPAANLSIAGEEGFTLGTFTAIGFGHSDRFVDTENQIQTSDSGGLAIGALAAFSGNKSNIRANIGPFITMAGNKDSDDPGKAGFVGAVNIGVGGFRERQLQTETRKQSSKHGWFMGGGLANASGDKKQAIAGITDITGNLVWGAVAQSGENGRGAMALSLGAVLSNSRTWYEDKGQIAITGSKSSTIGGGIAMASGSGGITTRMGPLTFSAE